VLEITSSRTYEKQQLSWFDRLLRYSARKRCRLIPHCTDRGSCK